MPGPQLTATRGGETRTFAGDDAELLRAAVEKGWAIDGHTVVTRPDSGYRAVANNRADLLEAATAKGWTPVGGAREDTTVGLPDIPLAAEQGPVTLEGFAPDLAKRDEAITARKVQEDIALQHQREAQRAALEREFGAGLTTAQGIGNAVGTVGEGLARGASIGFDAPMAYAQAGAASLLDAISPANPDVPLGFGQALDESQARIAGHVEANPLLAAGADITGAVLPTLATGGETLAMRLAARTPAGLLGRAGARMGVRAAGVLGLTGTALEAPGLAGSLARVAGPAVRLGVEGGSQGVAQGAVRAANDLWLSDDHAGAWDLVRAGAGGAWSGGLLGTTLGGAVGLGLGLRAARAGDAGKKTLQGMGLLSETPVSKLPPTDPAMVYSSPEPPSVMRGAVASHLKLTPEQAAEAHKAAYPKLRNTLNRYFTLSQRFDNELDLVAKKAFVRANALADAPVDFGSMRAELGLDRASLEALAEHGAVKFDGKGGSGSVLRLASQLDALEDDLFLQATKRQLTEGDAFIAADQAKRDLQKAVAQANRNNGFLFDLLDPKGAQLRGFLEDDTVWSPALAEMQRKTNAGWAKSITARMDSDLSSMAAQRGVKSEYNAYDFEDKVSDSWLMSHMSGVGAHPAEEQTAEAVNRWLNASSDDVLTRAGAYGDEGLVRAAEEMNTLRRVLQNDLGEIAKVNANTGATSVASAIAQSNKLGVLNQVPGVSYVIEAAMDRAREWAHKATVSGIEAVDRAAELRALIGAARPSITGAVVRGVQGGEKASKAVEAYLRVALSGQPTREEQDSLAVLERTFGAEMAAAAAADMQRQREFLLAKSQTVDKLALLKYADAALNPIDAVERISRGLGTREDRETLEALNAPLLKRFTDSALNNLAGKETTYDDRLRASQALAMPLDPSLEPGRYAQHQAIAAQQSLQAAQQDKPGGEVVSPSNQRPPNMGKLLEE